MKIIEVFFFLNHFFFCRLPNKMRFSCILAVFALTTLGKFVFVLSEQNIMPIRLFHTTLDFGKNMRTSCGKNKLIFKKKIKSPFFARRQSISKLSTLIYIYMKIWKVIYFICLIWSVV